MSKKTLRLIRNRRAINCKPGKDGYDKEIHEALWKESLKSRKEDAKKVQQARMNKICTFETENRYKDVWIEIKRMYEIMKVHY